VKFFCGKIFFEVGNLCDDFFAVKSHAMKYFELKFSDVKPFADKIWGETNLNHKKRVFLGFLEFQLFYSELNFIVLGFKKIEFTFRVILYIFSQANTFFVTSPKLNKMYVKTRKKPIKI
jgi:hypothetical protein